ncbi:C25 family cysteine peptidase, partial [Mariniblastus sp.]|nr:C25 family cysteine peptidase [Mariniblastus sp.]
QAYPKLGTSMDAIAEVWPKGIISQFFANRTAWDDVEKGDHDLTQENWVEMINDRQASKIHMHGHGLLHCWVLEQNEMVKQDCLSQLTNERAYPIITTVSCLTGQYDDEKDPSIAESMLRLPKAGAIAILAPSREGVPFMMKESDFPRMLYDGKMDGTTASYTKFWEAALSEDVTLGEAFRQVKINMTDKARENDGYHLCQCELNLLGDPSLSTLLRPTILKISKFVASTS